MAGLIGLSSCATSQYRAAVRAGQPPWGMCKLSGDIDFGGQELPLYALEDEQGKKGYASWLEGHLSVGADWSLTIESARYEEQDNRYCRSRSIVRRRGIDSIS